MKFISCLFLLLILSATTAQAANPIEPMPVRTRPIIAPDFTVDENMIPKGSLGGSKVLPNFTDEQFQEALAVSDQCKAMDYLNTLYDCDCLGMTYLELTRKYADKESSFWIREEAQKQCPNLPGMAGKMYSQCVGWGPFSYGTDYNEFCECYSNAFAHEYGQNPTTNQYVTENQMTRALTSCNIGKFNDDELNKRAFIDSLKEKGVYEKMFPGSASNPVFNSR